MLNAAGQFRVEVQKTRSSKSDPESRFYSSDSFDVVAACVFSATGRWEFLFGRTRDMQRHRMFTDRLAPVQTIGTGWATALADADQTPAHRQVDVSFPDALAAGYQPEVADVDEGAVAAEADELDLRLVRPDPRVEPPRL